jgi:ABC-type polysaccharide/polyol phosphate export permease
MVNTLDFLKPFGIDLFCLGKKFLVFNLVGRNLKVKYRRSVLGVLWTLVSPLSMVCVFYFVFKLILKVQMPHYLAFLVGGMIPWSFYQQSVMEGLDSVLGNSSLISKIPIPVQVFPFVGTLTNFITLVIALPIMIGVSIFSGVELGGSVILLPYLFLCLFLICYGVALILGVLHVYFRDLKHLTSILMQLWFYGTPVIYDVAMIPPKYHWVIYANPVGGCFVGFHQILGAGIWPDSSLVLSAGLWAVATSSVALALFKASYRDVAENL